jgi:GNAT superfamily N-acetyltransferase
VRDRGGSYRQFVLESVSSTYGVGRIMSSAKSSNRGEPRGSLRRIVEADIPELFRVRVATWHNPNGAEELARFGITPESVATQLRTTHCGWLWEVDGRVVGFAIGDRSNGEMWVIAVLKEHEGQGIGGRLLRAVETWLFSEGWKEIWLTTDLDPAFRAVGFYRSQGWEDWKLEADRFMRKRAA